MTVHVLVEGPSEHALLRGWLPRVLGDVPFKVHPHQGKGALPANAWAIPDPRHRGLLDQLPAKLRGFASGANAADVRVLVLVDADDDDPAALRDAICAVAVEVSPHLAVTVGLAIEETEAFYLGDLKGLEKAFPDADMDAARDYVPDSICGTWETFGKVVHDAGGNKVAWAEAMAPVLTTAASRSRSPSFREFVQSLSNSPAKSAAPAKKRRYRHATKNRTESGRRR